MASPVAKKYKGAQLASNVPTFSAPVGRILGAAHTFPSLPTTESVWTDAQMKSAGIILSRVSRLNLELATYSNNMAKAISARDRLLAAIVAGDKPGITGVLKGLSKLQMDKEILKVTALPHILSDRDVWRGLTAFDSTFAAVLRQKWKTSLMVVPSDNINRFFGTSPLVGFKAYLFKDKVMGFVSWLDTVDQTRVEPFFVKKLAIGLVLSGFDSPNSR
jgi:hypothetical protein